MPSFTFLECTETLNTGQKGEEEETLLKNVGLKGIFEFLEISKNDLAISQRIAQRTI